MKISLARRGDAQASRRIVKEGPHRPDLRDLGQDGEAGLGNMNQVV